MTLMKIFYSIIFFSLFVAVAKGQNQNDLGVNDLVSQRVKLPNGWRLSPAGRTFPLGDLPLNIAVSSSKKLIAVTNNGQSIQSVQLIDPKAEKVLSSVIIPKSWY